MKYGVFKWHFTTDVRFGTNKGQLSDSEYIMHSDTLFSALCIEALKIGGEEMLEKLYQLSHEQKLLFSDTMPYRNETYFLPKPMLRMATKEQQSSSVLKKAAKKLKYISAEAFQDYLYSLSGQGTFDLEKANRDFAGSLYNQNRVMVSVSGQDEPLPYYVNSWHFAEDAGLYLIVGYENEDDLYFLAQLIVSLGYSGVGGKKSSGLGKFWIDDVIFLDDAYSDGLEALQTLLGNPGQIQMTLSLALPRADELEDALKGATYQVLKRSGFIDSVDYALEQRKHRNLYVLAAGACFSKTFKGDIYNLATKGRHPVYRYAQPLFLGVNL